jgi:CelD/BcsL family acetyltransferase involved in cellulose biosynthesis
VSGTLRLVVLKEIPEDENLRRQWDALVEQIDQPQVFYTYEWALAVQCAYGTTRHPLIFLAYDDQDSLCGVAALATISLGKEVGFLCATTGDYCDFVSLPEHKESFVAEVLAQLKRENIHEIRLANLPSDSVTVSALRHAARSQRYYRFSRTAYVCAQVSLGSLQRRGENKPVLPRKKMLRRFLNAMGRAAPVQLQHARTRDEAQAVLPGFIDAHVARFLATGRISNLASKERRVFLAELAKLLSERGWFALTTMRAGEKIFAWNYGFQFRGTWFWYQPTFDGDFEKYSPGFCLLAKVIEEAAEMPELKTVDLGLGAEDYKDRFANQTRETLHVTLTNSAARLIQETVRSGAAAMVKFDPRVEATVRSILARLQRVKKHFAREPLSQVCVRMARRVRASLLAETEVIFYQVSGSSGVNSGEMSLCPLDLHQLAVAVPFYLEDAPTLAYLLRAAARSRSTDAHGFVMVKRDGTPVHFVWTTSFHEFFLSELNDQVSGTLPTAVMLFDCWTPPAVRGRGYYAQAVNLVASHVTAEGKEPWIFSAAANTASVRGLEKAGFRRHYSLTRRRILWRQTISRQPHYQSVSASEEISARV